MPGCRSSDFFCRVHLLVAVSTASMMSFAMLRGRGLVIGLLRVVGQDDRALAAVRILDVRGREMQRADHRRASIGPYLGQGALQPFAGGAEGAERIADSDAPVRAGDELTRNAAALRQAGLMQPEGELDDVWDAFAGRALALLVLERVGAAACGE